MTIPAERGMTSRDTWQIPAGDRAVSFLLVCATAVLLFLYYFARTDTIGVTSSVREWIPMTIGALPIRIHIVASVALMALLPILVARRATRLSLSQLGLGIGDWRRGGTLLLAGLPIAVFAGYVGSSSAALQAVYPLDPIAARDGFVLYSLVQSLFFFAWEILFRGVLLFGLESRVGRAPANAIQTALSVTAHFGRAVNEAAAALPAGLAFGWLALRTRSIWYGAVLHWTVNASMEFFILMRATL